METRVNDEIKKVIMAELPRLIESDPDIRRFILSVTRDIYADKKETESRIDRILDELKKDREARDKKWEAQDKKWDDQQKKWEENQNVINDMLVSIKATNRRIDSSIGALGARWGLQTEDAFRSGLKAILEESFGVKVERYEDYDHDGIIFGRPDQVELDIIVHDGTLILCEIKPSMSKSDMYTFWRKKDFYEHKHGRKASRIMVISPMVDDRARAVAKELDIEVYGSEIQIPGFSFGR